MADVFTEILESFGITDPESITADEQAELFKWVEKVEKSVITLEDIKLGTKVMRESLEAEIINFDNKPDRDMFLKARLKNLLLLETILNRPDRARAALEQYMSQGKMRKRT